MLSSLWRHASGWASLPLYPPFHHCVHVVPPLTSLMGHLLGYGHVPIRIRRHDGLRNVLYQALLQDNSSTRREQRIFGDSQDRPGDIFHPDFMDSMPTYFDVSVCNTLQSSCTSLTKPILLVHRQSSARTISMPRRAR